MSLNSTIRLETEESCLEVCCSPEDALWGKEGKFSVNFTLWVEGVPLEGSGTWYQEDSNPGLFRTDQFMRVPLSFVLQNGCITEGFVQFLLNVEGQLEWSEGVVYKSRRAMTLINDEKCC